MRQSILDDKLKVSKKNKDDAIRKYSRLLEFKKSFSAISKIPKDGRVGVRIHTGGYSNVTLQIDADLIIGMINNQMKRSSKEWNV